jgi:hypothetical protein
LSKKVTITIFYFYTPILWEKQHDNPEKIVFNI